jgi:hypothetical protein
VSEPGDRAPKRILRGSQRTHDMRMATAGFRIKWTWNCRSPRGPRARRAHMGLMHGNRETSKGPAGRW